MASSQSSKHLPSPVATATPPIPDPVSDMSPSMDAVLDLDFAEGYPPPLSASAPSVIAPVSAAVAASVSPSRLPPPLLLSPPPPTLDLVNPSIVRLDPDTLRSVSARGANLQPICVVDGEQLGHWTLNTQGALILQIDAAMSDAQRAELLRLTSNFVQRKVWAKPKRKSTPKATQARTVAQLDLFETVQAADSSPSFSTMEHA